MEKSILNLGKSLSKDEQKNVLGGGGERLKHYDPNCATNVSEGVCYGYSIGGVNYYYPGNEHVFDVGLGGSGSGYFEYACNC